jgi:hypothetical protein
MKKYYDEIKDAEKKETSRQEKFWGKKKTTKYQLVRNGELYNTVYDTLSEAEQVGRNLMECGFIQDFYVKPCKAIWVNC